MTLSYDLHIRHFLRFLVPFTFMNGPFKFLNRRMVVVRVFRQHYFFLATQNAIHELSFIPLGCISFVLLLDFFFVPQKDFNVIEAGFQEGIPEL